jgi:hypothetical protein
MLRIIGGIGGRVRILGRTISPCSEVLLIIIEYSMHRNLSYKSKQSNMITVLSFIIISFISI